MLIAARANSFLFMLLVAETIRIASFKKETIRSFASLRIRSVATISGRFMVSNGVFKTLLSNT